MKFKFHKTHTQGSLLNLRI